MNTLSPQIATTISPLVTNPNSTVTLSARLKNESRVSEFPSTYGITPLESINWFAVLSLLVIASIVAVGKYLLISLAALPDSVPTTITFAPKASLTSAVPFATAEVIVTFSFLHLFLGVTNGSIFSAILAITETASIGYFPFADSPESITQSVPSRIALATSFTSALVGLGFLIIESSIWVAVITTFPTALHLSIIIFWATGTSSTGISTPRSPLATMIPSDSSRISSKLSTPSWFSILEIIWTSFPPFSSSTLLTSLTSSAFLINEAAT